MSSLRVILVEMVPARSPNVIDLVEGAGCEVVARLGNTPRALDGLPALHADLVVMPVESPDAAVLQRLMAMQRSVDVPVVMFAADDDSDSIRRAVESGACAYITDGVNPSRVRAILDATLARHRQLRALMKELERTRGQLNERKLIERAKGIIMAQRGLTEELAYKLLRKTAMDRNKRMVEIADGIIAASELLGDQASLAMSPPARVG